MERIRYEKKSLQCRDGYVAVDGEKEEKERV